MTRTDLQKGWFRPVQSLLIALQEGAVVPWSWSILHVCKPGRTFCKVEMLYGLDGASKTMADGKQLDMLKSYGITFRAYYELFDKFKKKIIKKKLDLISD